MRGNALAMVFLTAVGIMLPLAATGCSGYGIAPAPIHEVSVSVAESFPPQIFVYIKGGLRDGCTTFNDLNTSRNETTVTIKVTTKHPRNKVCPAVYTFFEKNVSLGSDFVPG